MNIRPADVAMLALLKKLEWSKEVDREDTNYECPICGAAQTYRHYDSLADGDHGERCELDATIVAYEKLIHGKSEREEDRKFMESLR